jgi:hypothetical protein
MHKQIMFLRELGLRVKILVCIIGFKVNKTRKHLYDHSIRQIIFILTFMRAPKFTSKVVVDNDLHMLIISLLIECSIMYGKWVLKPRLF